MKIGEITVINGVKTWRKTDTEYMVFLPCKKCGMERWIRRTELNRPNYEGHCKHCLNNHKLGTSKYIGRHYASEGYVIVQVRPDSPFYSMVERNGYVKEHRLVMAQSLGRCLLHDEVVHHLNSIRDDNRPENLVLTNPSSHSIEHQTIRYSGRLSDRDADICRYRKEHPTVSYKKMEHIFGTSYANIFRIVNYGRHHSKVSKRSVKVAH